ncbi:RGCVC family protein [Actinosynnema sp. CA-299493]
MNHVLPTIDSTDAPAAEVDAAGTTAAASPRCAACPHPLESHDRIALRFCTATTSESHSRGCVCGS